MAFVGRSSHRNADIDSALDGYAMKEEHLMCHGFKSRAAAQHYVNNDLVPVFMGSKFGR
jgi:hypothetical protein